MTTPMTMDDIAKQIEEAKERGRWEGKITEKLDSLNVQIATMNTFNAELRGLLQGVTQSISDLRAAQHSLREDQAEDRERLKRLELGGVDRREVEGINANLKALNDRMDGFGNMLFRLTLASLGGGGVSAASILGIAKAVGILP